MMSTGSGAMKTCPSSGRLRPLVLRRERRLRFGPVVAPVFTFVDRCGMELADTSPPRDCTARLPASTVLFSGATGVYASIASVSRLERDNGAAV